MKTVTLTFEDDVLYDDFIGWFCDGGGEDDFYNAQEITDRKLFITNLKFDDSKVVGINFKEAPDEE